MTRQTIAKKFNLNIETVRYYEELGLIQPKRNKENGYRDYGEIEVIKLDIIVRFKKFGFKLKDIKRFFDFLIENNDNETNQDFNSFIDKKVDDIDKQIAGLNSVKESLKKFQSKEDRETCVIYSKLLNNS